MEQTNYNISFNGKGLELFKIQIVNLILTVVTLGLYYPWARAKTLQYLYGQTTFQDQPFAFTGTGIEMFKGFIKAILILVAVYGIVLGASYSGHPIIGMLFFYLIIFTIIPLALHGSYKYRMAKTIWQGIRFGYVGNKKELIVLFVKGILLTICTLGFYGAWFAMNIRKYIVDNIKVGNASFNYDGDGANFLVINIKGYLLSIITLGIYFFWWKKELFDYFVNKLSLTQGDKGVRFTSKATGVRFAKLLIGNFFILICTLGLGYPWTIVRTLTFTANNIEMSGDFSFDELQQSQEEFSDATGSDLSDFFDLGFTI